MQSQSIELKQQYLRQNIIDAGYDAEDFVQYCSNHHNLSDLGDWSMNKLIEVVQLYIGIQKKQSTSQNQSTEKEQNEWQNYEQAPSEKQGTHHQTKAQTDNNHNTTKTGNLVFSQADWAIFLGSSPVQHPPQPIKTTVAQEPKKVEPHQSRKIWAQSPKKAETQPESHSYKNVPLDKIGKSSQKQVQISEKQSPLSPPSQDTGKQITNLKSLIQEGTSKNQNRGPINFTNLKLSTSKLKPLPKLAQINDIVITKTQQVARNFLQSDYTLYYIHFMPGNHVIQRKFADLRKLRSLLHNMYPHIRLPFLEPEGWLTSSEGKDTQTLAKYKWMVVDFLKYVTMRNEELQNCPLVRRFCGFPTNPKSEKDYEQVSKQELKKMFQTFENVHKPKHIGQLCLTNNFILLPPSNDGQKIYINTVNLIDEIDHEYQKLKKKFQNLFYYYDCFAKAISDVSGSFQSLENMIKKYNFDNDEPKQFRVYEGIRQMCNKMHSSMNQQYVIFKTRIKNILRFEKDNMTTLKEIFEIRNKIHAEYSRQGYPTLSKNSQSGGGQVQIQSNIPIEEPCRGNKNNLCVQQIFWSHFMKKEVNTYLQELRKKINQQLTMISYEELDNQNDNLNFWNSMIKKCVV